MSGEGASGEPAEGLLTAADPSPVVVRNAGAASPFLLVGDHAGRAVPARLSGLGVSAHDMDRHIAWDIGVGGLGQCLSQRLDACFIAQAYSRLVIDCNRRLGAQGSIAEVSDGVRIAGNEGLGAAEVLARQTEIFAPYHDEIARQLDARAGVRTILVALHSFTPAMAGFERPWRFGVLHRDDSPFSAAMLALLREGLGDAVGDNQPYELGDNDNTVPLHADPRGLDYLELEVRQDLLATEEDQEKIAAFLGPLMLTALARGLAER